ncbi:MAG: hypothetical protein A3G34_09405 [Candidatus Lindowbacteria bacterium RIFCSPLOWO2_12_FULL_62_27]|nr:MAG: hypothetical protein A3I06_08070 [Candidatus Lindowbacteria bacterium RIFCSPLOWO2_02_FULL_62_12]OGH60253.1 MAG: hypothetical protein A3G34_09405 [Candidatus Lindowbacteria bacterium RIFCSPLOWO2_12_FULL_62_27]
MKPAGRSLLGILLVAFAVFPVRPAQAEPESAYYAALMRKESATVEDAVRLLARMRGYAGESDMRSEMRHLDESGVQFKRDIEGIRNSALTAGNAAHLLLQATGLKGGVMSWVFPSSQRYALRQAIHLGLLPETTAVEDRLSGKDLMGMVSKLAQRARGRLK